MPNFRYSQSYVGRRAGKNVVATAAYNAAEKLHQRGNEALANSAYQTGQKLGKDGRTFNFEGKDGVLFTEIMAPENAPDWVRDREELWNRADHAEKRKDSRLARKVIISTPHELTLDQTKEMMRGFIKDHFVKDGIVVDYAIHAPDRDGDSRHYHVHLLCTRRELTSEGFGKLFREQEQGRALWLGRKAMEKHMNRALERAGIMERVSADNVYVRGVVREPEPVLGAKGIEEQRQQKHSRRGNLDDRTKERMVEVEQVRMRNKLRADYDRKGEAHPEWLMQYYRQGRDKWMKRQQNRIDKVRARGNIYFAAKLERDFSKAKENARNADATYQSREGGREEYTERPEPSREERLSPGAGERPFGSGRSFEEGGPAQPSPGRSGRGGKDGGRNGGGHGGSSGRSSGGSEGRNGRTGSGGSAPKSGSFIVRERDPLLDDRGNRRDTGDSFIISAGIDQLTRDLQATFPNAPRRDQQAKEPDERDSAAQTREELRQRDPGKDFGLTGLPSGQHSLPEDRLGIDREEDEREM